MSSIASLPPEILGCIIHQIIESRPEMFGICACISRGWQLHVEKRTFSSLRLDQASLEAARDIVTRHRQNYVRHVQMDVSLPEYDAEALWLRPETHQEQRLNNQAFTDGIKQLFSTLSAWESLPDRAENSISLSLAAFSLSDFVKVPDMGRRILRRKRWTSSHLGFVDETHNELSTLPFITEFNVNGQRLMTKICRDAANDKQNYSTMDMWPQERRLVPRACCDIAARLVCVRNINWELEEDKTQRPLGRMKLRTDFATGLTTLPESVRHFRLRYPYYTLIGLGGAVGSNISDTNAC